MKRIIDCDLVITKPLQLFDDLVITGNLYASASINACNIEVGGDIFLLSDSDAVIDAYEIRCKTISSKNFIFCVDSIIASEGVKLEDDRATEIIFQGDNINIFTNPLLWDDD